MGPYPSALSALLHGVADLDAGREYRPATERERPGQLGAAPSRRR